MRRRICTVTSTRADYGLLAPVMRAITGHADLELQVLATGSHLSREHGMTIEAIERDGFSVSARVEMLLASDSSIGVAKSMGLGLIGFADAFQQLMPDVVLLLGDRFEILAAATAAFTQGIPLAHIAGGDVTEGALDEGFRHAITKLASVHFVTNADAARRVRQMGEDPARIVISGSPGIDAILAQAPTARDEIESRLGFKLRARNLLITFHPETATTLPADAQVVELLAALDQLAGEGLELGLIFTGANADAGGRAVKALVQRYVDERPHSLYRESLGQALYLGTMRHVDAVVGNSSSGLYEAPSLRVPTVNIGDRQKGRLLASSVINCPTERTQIHAAILAALALDCSSAINPYGDGHAAKRIAAWLADTPLTCGSRKAFHDLPV